MLKEQIEKSIEDIMIYAKLQGTENSPEWKKVIDWHKTQQIELIKKVMEIIEKDYIEWILSSSYGRDYKGGTPFGKWKQKAEAKDMGNWK